VRVERDPNNRTILGVLDRQTGRATGKKEKKEIPCRFLQAIVAGAKARPAPSDRRATDRVERGPRPPLFRPATPASSLFLR
jgi:hypothetical protein